jgi:glutamate synthase domain-containing protein 3
MEAHPVIMNLKGTAGQSLGVWNAGGLHIKLEGDANDYVGKGMAGGRVSIFPPKGSPFQTQQLQLLVTPVCTVQQAVSYLQQVRRVSVLQYVTQVRLP